MAEVTRPATHPAQSNMLLRATGRTFLSVHPHLGESAIAPARLWPRPGSFPAIRPAPRRRIRREILVSGGRPGEQVCTLMYDTKNTAHVLFSDPIAIRYSAYTSTGLDPQD